MFNKNNSYFKIFIQQQLKKLEEELDKNLEIVKKEKEFAKHEIIYSESMKKRNYMYIYYKRYNEYIN
jgi:hypothetical protein